MNPPTPLFIVGCPRSGSTWTTWLLAQHPAVATFQHAKVFDYLAMADRWHHNKAGYSYLLRPGTRPGEDKADPLRLEAFLGRAEYRALLGEVVRGILAKVATVAADCQVVVDKTPENGHHGELIVEAMPEARFLHILRDPRDVFCSHRSASRGWAKWEFPTRPVDGARYWLRDVDAARSIRERTDHYLEVRYEDIKANGPEELQRLYGWLGLAATDEFCRQAVDACRKDRMRGHQVLPEGFVRKTTEGGWRDELTTSEVQVIEYLAGDRMTELGYERLLPRPRSAPLRVRLHDLPEPLLAWVKRTATRVTSLAHWGWVGRKLEWPWP